MKLYKVVKNGEVMRIFYLKEEADIFARQYSASVVMVDKE